MSTICDKDCEAVRNKAAVCVEGSLAGLESFALDVAGRMEKQLERYMLEKSEKSNAPESVKGNPECWPSYFASLRIKIEGATGAIQQIVNMLDRLEF